MIPRPGGCLGPTPDPTRGSQNQCIREDTNRVAVVC